MKRNLIPPTLRVRDWNSTYENNRSRELARTGWFPVPNDLSSDSFVELVYHPHGAAHLGVWLALLMVASKSKMRGLLLRADLSPHTSESLALVTRLSKDLIEVAIERLLKIGLLEISKPKPRNKNDLVSHPSAAGSQGGAPESQDVAAERKRTEGNGIEHHHQEEKRKEVNRIERENGIEARSSEPPCSSSSDEDDDDEKAKAVFSHKFDDDEKTKNHGNLPAREQLSDPRAEFSLRLQERHGAESEFVRAEWVDAVLKDLSKADFTLVEFLEFDARTTTNPRAVANPAGYYRGLVKKMAGVRKTSVLKEVVDLNQQISKYLKPPSVELNNQPKCPECKEPLGRGLVLITGDEGEPKYGPCVCATPEFRLEWEQKEMAREERRKALEADKAAAAEVVEPGDALGDMVHAAALMSEVVAQ
jgi:hypothetical protein